jgi:hypothetical protein
VSAVAPSAAEEVKLYFLDRRAVLWEAEHMIQRAAPEITILTEAQAWIDSGLPASVIMSVVDRGMRRVASTGKSPPSSLKAYHLSLGDALADYRRSGAVPAGVAPPKVEPLSAEAQAEVEQRRRQVLGEP